MFSKNRLQLVPLVMLGASIFFGELATMLVVSLIPPIPFVAEALVDATSITLVMLPLLYFVSFRPLAMHLAQRVHAEEELRKAHDEMELRVQRRTTELTATNESLLQAMETIRRNEEHFRSLIENISDIVLVVGGDSIVRYASPSVEEVLGYQSEDLIGKNAFDFLHPDDTPGLATLFNEVIQNGPGAARSAEFRMRRKDGSWRNAGATGKTIRSEEGEVNVVVTARDITASRHAEERAQRHLARMMALHDIDMAITASLDWRITLSMLLEQVTTQLRVDATCFLLFNPLSHTLEYAAASGFRSAAIKSTALHLGEGHAGRAAYERRAVYLPDLEATGDAFVRGELFAGEEFVAYYAVPLIARGHVKGVLEAFHRAPLDVDDEWKDFLEALAGQAAIAIDNASLLEELQRSNAELTVSYDATLEGWVAALDLRHKETEGHSQRVTEMTMRLARVFGVSDAELVHVRRGALLHDIGKMGVPDGTLLKPGPLGEEEWAVMRLHPVYASQFLSRIPFLRPALDIPHCHHEKWDGSGYPLGLKGKDIPLAARIFALADVWDALRSDRVYRPAWPEEKVRKYIVEQSGTQFDPEVVETFLEVLEYAFDRSDPSGSMLPPKRNGPLSAAPEAPWRCLENMEGGERKG